MTSKPLIFVHIQKTGGSTIARALGQEEHPPHKHWTAAELFDLYGAEAWRSRFKFAFVRNPWDRLVSWWSMIDAARSRLTDGSQVNGFFRYVQTHAATFEEFIRNCHEDVTDPDGRKCIFRNQIDYLTGQDHKLAVDFIGRFETLQADFDRVCELNGIPPVSLPHLNKSSHDHYSCFYDKQLQSIVGDAYAKDIDAFGYTFGS